MKVRRVTAVGLLSLAATLGTAVPAALAAQGPVLTRGEGWVQQGSYDSPDECEAAGTEGVEAGQWADYTCADSEQGAFDLWVNQG